MAKMILTPNSSPFWTAQKGETMAKVMKTLVVYGETFGQPRWCRHRRIRASGYELRPSVMKPVYALMDQLIRRRALRAEVLGRSPSAR
jgi:hypothetical protein